VKEHVNYRRVGIIAAVAPGAALLIAWAAGLLPQRKAIDEHNLRFLGRQRPVRPVASQTTVPVP
jgi:hypothetical protein